RISPAKPCTRVLPGRHDLVHRGRYLSILEADRSEELPYRSIGALAQIAVLGIHSACIGACQIPDLDLAPSYEFTTLRHLGKSWMSTRFPPVIGNRLGTLAMPATFLPGHSNSDIGGNTKGLKGLRPSDARIKHSTSRQDKYYPVIRRSQVTFVGSLSS